MPIDPTTLHGRPWKSLTVEEREACPDGTELRHPTENFGPFRRVGGLWVDARFHQYDTEMMSAADPMGYVVHIPDVVPTGPKPTTLHGRTLRSLTVEELEACPEGSALDLPKGDPDPIVKRGGMWVMSSGRRWVSGEVVEFAVTGRRLRLPGVPTPEDAAVPTPDQFREMHQLLGGKTDPARIPRPNERPPVYAIGRFVVMPAVGGVFAVDASQITGVGPVGDGTLAYVLQGEQCPLPPGVTVLDLLHAIAKAEGR